MKKNGLYSQMTQEEIDTIIRTEISKAPRRGITNSKTIWKDDLTLSARRQSILDLFCKGYTRRKVMLEIKDRWGCVESVAYEYISDALNYLEDVNKEDSKVMAQEMKEKITAIAQDALLHNDRKTALQAYDMLNKIGGLYVNKVDADVKGDMIIQFDFQ